jgi:hypothetical protein
MKPAKAKKSPVKSLPRKPGKAETKGLHKVVRVRAVFLERIQK